MTKPAQPEDKSLARIKKIVTLSDAQASGMLLGGGGVERQGTFISQATTREEVLGKESQLEEELRRIRDRKSATDKKRMCEKSKGQMPYALLGKQIRQEKIVVGRIPKDTEDAINDVSRDVVSEGDQTNDITGEVLMTSRTRTDIERDVHSRGLSSLQRTYGPLRQMWVNNKPVRKDFLRHKRIKDKHSSKASGHARPLAAGLNREDTYSAPNPSPVHYKGLIVRKY